MYLRGGQNKDHIGRRFLQGLKQRVEGSYGKHMDLIDDIDPVTALCGRILNLFPDIPDILHAVVGGRVNLHHIHGGTRENGPAGGTFIAGTSIQRMLAVHRPGKDLGDTGLSGTPCAAEKVRVACPAGNNLVFQRLYNGVLAFYVLKGNRTPFAVQCRIGHIFRSLLFKVSLIAEADAHHLRFADHGAVRVNGFKLSGHLP